MSTHSDPPLLPRNQMVLGVGLVFIVIMAAAFFLSRQPKSKDLSEPITGKGAPSQVVPGDLFDMLAVEQPDWLIRSSLPLIASNLPPHEFYQWELDYEWTEFNGSSVGRVLAEYLKTNAPIARIPLEKPIPSLEPVKPLPMLLMGTSRLECAGSLAVRPLVGYIKLQSWTNSDVLMPSVIQASVNPAGTVLHTRLLQKSGLTNADNTALKLSRSMRFQPLEGANEAAFFGAENLASGKLIFNWHTEAAAITNTKVRELPFRSVVPR